MEMSISERVMVSHPLEILATHNGKYTVASALEAMKDESTCIDFFMNVFGEEPRVIESLLKEDGYLLDDDYRTVRSEGFGMRTMGHRFDTMHFILYSALLGSSNYEYPKPQAGIKYLNLSNLIEQLDSLMPDSIMNYSHGKTYLPDLQRELFKLYIPEEQHYKLSKDEATLLAELYTEAKLFGEDELASTSISNRYKKLLQFLVDFLQTNVPDVHFMLSKADAHGVESEVIEIAEIFPLATSRCSKDDVIAVLKLFKETLGKNIKGEYQIELFEETDNTWTAIIDKKAVYKVTEEGVYREDQRVHCTVVSSRNGYYLYDSFGSFIFFLMNYLPLLKSMVEGDVYKVGQWETRYILGNIPLDAEAIMGMETTGIRPHYNRTVAQLYEFNIPYYLRISLPKYNEFTKEMDDAYVRINGGEEKGRVTRSTGNKYATADKVLAKYNLFLCAKSLTFMDNRYLAVRLIDVPVAERRQMVIDILLNATHGFSLDAAIAKLFKYEVKDAKDRELVLNILEEVLILLDTEKKNKATARKKLGIATTPNFLCKGVLTGFIPALCLIDPEYTRDIELNTPCIFGKNLSANAGVSIMLEDPDESDYFFVRTTIRDTIELYDEDLISVCVGRQEDIETVVHPSGKITHNLTTPCVYNIFNGIDTHELSSIAAYDAETGKFDPEADLKGVYVLKGTPVLRVGYKLESQEGDILYNTYTVPEDMIVDQITLNKNAYGSMALVIKGIYPMNFAKPRGPAKIMPGFSVTGRHYAYNSLNKDLPNGAKIVVTADCLKHGDLLQRELPYICATANQNGHGHLLTQVRNAIGYTDEVLAEFKELGLLGNVSSEVPFLPYDPTAAAAKHYAELRKWFWDRYGQARWFYNRDVQGGLLNTLALGLLDRSAITTETVIEGKTYSLVSEVRIEEGKPTPRKDKEGKVQYKLYKDEYWIKRTVAELEAFDPSCAGRFPANGIVITSCSSGNPAELSKYDDVFVFYSTKHEHCPAVGWQRTWVAGPIVNEEGKVEQVYLPNKPELTDFKVNCTKANLMMAVPLNVSCDNGLTKPSMELASRLISNYREQIDKYSMLMAMINGQAIRRADGTVIPTIKVFTGTDDDSVMSDDFIDYLVEDEERCTYLDKVGEERKVTIKELYHHFREVILDMGMFKLFIPAIAEQDMMGTSAESTSGLLKDLFKDVLLDAKYGEVKQRLRRMLSSIHTAVGHNMYEDNDHDEEEDYVPEYKSGMSILRKMTQGRKSLLSKIIGIPGLPFKNVIPYSELPGSTAQHYLDLCRERNIPDEDIFGAELWVTKDTDPRSLIHRCPLSSQDLVPNVLVRKGQYWMDFTDDEPGCRNDLWMLMRHGVYLIYQQGKLIIIQFGDCDGDGLNVTMVDKDLVGYTEDCDTNHCEQSIILATGYNTWQKEQGGYFMDQMIPKVVDLESYLEGTSLSKKNISLLNCRLVKGEDGYVKRDTIDHGDSWESISGLTVKEKEHHVGKAYTLKLWAEGVIATVNSLGIAESDKQLAAWTHLVHILKAISELYEGNPLAGYTPSGHKVMIYLAECMVGASRFKIDFSMRINAEGIVSGNRKADTRYADFYDFVDALRETGLNAIYACQYICIARSYSRVVKTAKKLGTLGLEELLEAIKEIKLGDFIYYTALAWFRATKGQLNLGSAGMRKQNLALMLVFHQYDIPHAEWGEKSLIIKWMNYAVPALFKAQAYPEKGWVIKTLFGDDSTVVISDDTFKSLN